VHACVLKRRLPQHPTCIHGSPRSSTRARTIHWDLAQARSREEIYDTILARGGPQVLELFKRFVAELDRLKTQGKLILPRTESGRH
jgi:hypothetical protein